LVEPYHRNGPSKRKSSKNKNKESHSSSGGEEVSSSTYAGLDAESVSSSSDLQDNELFLLARSEGNSVN
jgi:hypothetical protein